MTSYSFCRSCHTAGDGWHLDGGDFVCQTCAPNCTQCGVSFSSQPTKINNSFLCEDCNYNRKLPLFCKDCGSLAESSGRGYARCSNPKCGWTYHSNPKPTISIVGYSIPNDHMNSRMRRLDRLTTSFDGFFEWPSTELKPTFHGAATTGLNWDDLAKATPVYLLGYNVNKSDNLSGIERRAILEFSFLTTRLPFVVDETYMEKWGPAESPQRLKKIAYHIAGLCKREKSKKNDVTSRKYEDDLSYLKTKFYDSMFDGELSQRFAWPET